MSFEQIIYLINQQNYQELSKIKNPNVYNNNYQTPLLYAVYNNDLIATQILLQKGAIIDPNTMIYAIYNSDENIVIELAKRVTYNNSDYLIASINVNNMNYISKFIRQVNLPDSDGQYPLIRAIFTGDYEIADYLIKNRAYINQKNKEGKSPLFVAIEDKNPNIVKLLLDNGADTNYGVIINNYLQYPLHYAIMLNQAKIVKLLLKYGANKDIGNEKGNLPIDEFLDQTEQNSKILKYLIDSGVDFYVDNQYVITEILQTRDKKLIGIVLDALYKNEDEPIEYIVLNVLEEIEDLLERCNAILDVIDYFGLPKDTLNYLQAITPLALCEQYKSKRGKVRGKLASIGSTSPKLIKKPKNILDKFEDIPNKCYCLIHPFGIYKDVYIPIIRYAKNECVGYYGENKFDNPNFTWYYLEPGKKIYLYAPQCLITKNKITAVLELAYLNNREDVVRDLIYYLQKFLSTYMTDQEYALDTMNLNGFKNLEKKLLNPQKEQILEKVNNYFELKNGFLFSGGALDNFDEIITDLSRDVNIPVVILTHQAGCSGRLVSECVDNRSRKESFENIYRFK
jgi:ankyrin repeat protein